MRISRSRPSRRRWGGLQGGRGRRPRPSAKTPSGGACCGSGSGGRTPPRRRRRRPPRTATARRAPGSASCSTSAGRWRGHSSGRTTRWSSRRFSGCREAARRLWCAPAPLPSPRRRPVRAAAACLGLLRCRCLGGRRRRADDVPGEMDLFFTPLSNVDTAESDTRSFYRRGCNDQRACGESGHRLQLNQLRLAER